MMYLLELVSKLFIAVRKEKFDKAKTLCDEIKKVLDTYDNAC